MVAEEITYGHPDKFLTNLGFQNSNFDHRRRVYHHSLSDTLIVLAGHYDDLTARDVDLVSVRRHLVENGLVSDEEFAIFLEAATKV